jgi:hypothetical protein
LCRKFFGSASLLAGVTFNHHQLFLLRKIPLVTTVTPNALDYTSRRKKSRDPALCDFELDGYLVTANRCPFLRCSPETS